MSAERWIVASVLLTGCFSPEAPAETDGGGEEGATKRFEADLKKWEVLAKAKGKKEPRKPRRGRGEHHDIGELDEMTVPFGQSDQLPAFLRR